MKKKLLALAVLGAVAGIAQAQTNVTIYGSIDSGLRRQTNVNAAGDSVLTMGTGTYYSNRFGFKGVEDLGGGMNARFALETGFSSKTGALDVANTLFNRTASVGIGGSWGVVDFGRQYTVGFRTGSLIDPFNYKYVTIDPISGGGSTSLPAAAVAAGLGASSTSGTRFSNDIQYTGTFGPVIARAEYALGEVAGSTGNGAAQSVGLAYLHGPVIAAGSYTQKKTATGFKNKSYLLGGGYTFGSVKVKAGFSKEEQETAALGDLRNKLGWIGASYAITPATELTAGYFESRYNSNAAEGKRRLFLVGATYAFSKRTNLYADIDMNRYDGTLVPATGQTRQTGVSAGIMHLF
jgi:predicted porin